jgi:hypothetical protein
MFPKEANIYLNLKYKLILKNVKDLTIYSVNNTGEKDKTVFYRRF